MTEIFCFGRPAILVLRPLTDDASRVQHGLAILADHRLNHRPAQEVWIGAENIVIDLAIGSLDKAEFVGTGVGGHGPEQADVRALRGLNGTYPPIVGVVDVSNIEASALPRQSAGS